MSNWLFSLHSGQYQFSFTPAFVSFDVIGISCTFFFFDLSFFLSKLFLLVFCFSTFSFLIVILLIFLVAINDFS